MLVYTWFGSSESSWKNLLLKETGSFFKVFKQFWFNHVSKKDIEEDMQLDCRFLINLKVIEYQFWTLGMSLYLNNDNSICSLYFLNVHGISQYCVHKTILKAVLNFMMTRTGNAQGNSNWHAAGGFTFLDSFSGYCVGHLF